MDNIIVAIGVFFALSAIASIIFMYLRQSTVLAYIFVGVLIGLFKSHLIINQEIIDVISELGIILLLFLAGMELNIKELKKRLTDTLLIGFGEILGFVILGALLGFFLIGISSTVAAIYFGLCLAFSSTIIVIKLLKERKETESLHGQILISVLVLQDVVAIFALVFLRSVNTNTTVLISVLTILGKMLFMAAVLFLFSKFVLNGLFRKFAQSGEMLFVGTLGYVLGVAALSEFIHFSPELGAFIAGVSIANIKYRLEIEDKVEPIKNLGVVLFFVSLGFNLEFTSSLVKFLPLILILALTVLIITPVLILFLSYFRKLKLRPSFYVGIMMNQISEFSLVIATIALKEGVFDKKLFMIVTMSSILSIFLSSSSHSIMDFIYRKIKEPLEFIEKHSLKISDLVEISKLKLKEHIILLGYNEITDMIADDFAKKGIDVLILDTDPYKIRYIEKNESKHHHAIYVDPLDPDIWEELKFENASLIVSGMFYNTEAEKELLYYLKRKKSKASFIVNVDNYEDALELYERNASYVILPFHLSGIHIIELINRYEGRYDKIEENKDFHIEKIKKVKDKFIKGF